MDEAADADTMDTGDEQPDDTVEDADAADEVDEAADADAMDTGDEQPDDTAEDTDTADVVDETADSDATDTGDEQPDDTVEDADTADEVDEAADADAMDTGDEQPGDTAEDTDTTDETNDVNSMAVHGDVQKDVGSASDSVRNRDMSPMESLMEYMNSHNYGPDDFAEYSQDPVWRELQKQAYPDYKLPSLTPENAKQQLSEYMNAHNYGADDFSTYSQDPVWRDLQRQAYPEYDLPPLERADNLGHWKEIPPDTSFADNLDATNPNFEYGDEWTVNCQRCVPTYEMRARGYDVTALPCVEDNDYLSYHPYDVWENPVVNTAFGNGMNDIQSAMKGWGDGSRAQICVQWEKGDGGHTFIAEQKNGKTVFFDPQNGEMDASWYFDNVKSGSVTFCRTDNLMPSEKIFECCKEVRK